MANEPQSPAPTISGVTDTRAVTLASLAGKPATTTGALRNILPIEDVHLPVCAFGSSI